MARGKFFTEGDRRMWEMRYNLVNQAIARVMNGGEHFQEGLLSELYHDIVEKHAELKLKFSEVREENRRLRELLLKRMESQSPNNFCEKLNSDKEANECDATKPLNEQNHDNQIT
jgi:hypothetical protein